MSERIERIKDAPATVDEDACDLFSRHDGTLVVSSLFKTLTDDDFDAKPTKSARMDPVSGKVVEKGEILRKRRRLIYQTPNESVLTFDCFETLNERDALVMCAVGAMASGDLGRVIPLDEAEWDAQDRRAMAELKHRNLEMDVESRTVPYSVNTSLRSLCEMLGDVYNGDMAGQIARSLERLSKVHITWERASADGRIQKASFHLLSVGFDHKPGSFGAAVAVSVNAFTARAFLGGRANHIRIDMEDVRRLAKKRSSHAKLLHYRLCAAVGAGRKTDRPYAEDTLLGYLWSDMDTCSEFTRKKRRLTLRKAMGAISEALGWRFEVATVKGGGRAYRIARPKRAALACSNNNR